MPIHFLSQVLRLDPDKDKYVSWPVHWGESLTTWMNKLNKSHKYDSEKSSWKARKAWRNNCGFCASFILADCPPHGWGKLSPSKHSLLWQKHWIMHLRWEGRLAVGSYSTPSSFTSFPIHWQMRASKWSFTRGQRCRLRIDRHWGACPSFGCFLHHFTESGETPLSALSSDSGCMWEGPVASSEDVFLMTH